METNSVTFILLEVLVALLVGVVVFFKWRFKHWERRNIPYAPPTIPFGNIQNPFTATKHVTYIIKDLYNKMKAENVKEMGFFMATNPALITTDLELLKRVLIKDFEHFPDRKLYFNEKADPLSAHLAAIEGQKWKNLRNKLTPTFTSGKMRLMFGVLLECEEGLLELLEREVKTGRPIDIKEILARYTTDVIGSCAFGLDCKSIKQEDSEFRFYGRKMTAKTVSASFRRILAAAAPWFLKTFGIKTIARDVEAFFMKLVAETMEYREKNNIVRNDFLQMMIKLKNHENPEERLTLEEIAAQCFVFFGGGFDTSSSAMTFALYFLGKNQHIQDKAREEVRTVLKKHGGKMSYDAMQEMTYLSQVLDETLRILPPTGMTARYCSKDYTADLGDRVVTIKKGERVIAPILGIQHDPEYYPNPEVFNPDNFTEEAKASRPSMTYMPFGEGPRICIGMRFAIMQSRVGLAAVLNKYRFTVNKKTIEPLQIHPASQIFSAVGEIWLNAERVD